MKIVDFGKIEQDEKTGEIVCSGFTLDNPWLAGEDEVLALLDALIKRLTFEKLKIELYGYEETILTVKHV